MAIQANGKNIDHIIYDNTAMDFVKYKATPTGKEELYGARPFIAGSTTTSALGSGIKTVSGKGPFLYKSGMAQPIGRLLLNKITSKFYQKGRIDDDGTYKYAYAGDDLTAIYDITKGPYYVDYYYRAGYISAKNIVTRKPASEGGSVANILPDQEIKKNYFLPTSGMRLYNNTSEEQFFLVGNGKSGVALKSPTMKVDYIGYDYARNSQVQSSITFNESNFILNKTIQNYEMKGGDDSEVEEILATYVSLIKYKMTLTEGKSLKAGDLSVDVDANYNAFTEPIYRGDGVLANEYGKCMFTLDLTHITLDFGTVDWFFYRGDISKITDPSLTTVQGQYFGNGHIIGDGKVIGTNEFQINKAFALDKIQLSGIYPEAGYYISSADGKGQILIDNTGRFNTVKYITTTVLKAPTISGSFTSDFSGLVEVYITVSNPNPVDIYIAAISGVKAYSIDSSYNNMETMDGDYHNFKPFTIKANSTQRSAFTVGWKSSSSVYGVRSYFSLDYRASGGSQTVREAYGIDAQQ